MMTADERLEVRRQRYREHAREENIKRALRDFKHPLKCALRHQRYWQNHTDRKNSVSQLRYWTSEVNRLTAEGATE